MDKKKNKDRDAFGTLRSQSALDEEKPPSRVQDVVQAMKSPRFFRHHASNSNERSTSVKGRNRGDADSE